MTRRKENIQNRWPGSDTKNMCANNWLDVLASVLCCALGRCAHGMCNLDPRGPKFWSLIWNSHEIWTHSHLSSLSFHPASPSNPEWSRSTGNAKPMLSETPSNPTQTNYWAIYEHSKFAAGIYKTSSQTNKISKHNLNEEKSGKNSLIYRRRYYALPIHF